MWRWLWLVCFGLFLAAGAFGCKTAESVPVDSGRQVPQMHGDVVLTLSPEKADEYIAAFRVMQIIDNRPPAIQTSVFTPRLLAKFGKPASIAVKKDDVPALNMHLIIDNEPVELSVGAGYTFRCKAEKTADGKIAFSGIFISSDYKTNVTCYPFSLTVTPGERTDLFRVAYEQ